MMRARRWEIALWLLVFGGMAWWGGKGLLG